MKNWHYYIYLTLLFFLSNILWILLGHPVPLLLCATVALLTQRTRPTPLKLYAISLVCFEYFIAFDQLGPPLLYIVPIYALAPQLNQLLMPTARSLLPYVLFTLAFSIQKLALEPVTTGITVNAICTFLPFCATVLMYITLKCIGQRQFR